MNDAPLAVDDSATMAVGQTVDIPVLANDSDPDGDVLSLTDVGNARKGSVSMVGDLLRYTAGSRTGTESP